MEQINRQRVILDQIETFNRIVDLCNRYNVKILFDKKILENDEIWISIQSGDIKSDIYVDGADIYNEEIDLRYEVYDYKDKNELFRQFMKDFFDLVINV